MATHGSNPAAVVGDVENVGVETTRYSGGDIAVDGTITNVHVWLQSGFAGTEGSRFGVYRNAATSTSPVGATLIMDGGQMDTVNVNASRYWSCSELGGTPGGTFTAGRLWIFCKNQDGQMGLSQAAAGDLDTSIGSERSTNISGDITVAFPATWPADTGATGAECLMAYITYTAGGGDVLAAQAIF